MTIGIDGSRAFLPERTGIEEYSYQTIKHLRSVIPETDAVVLYVKKKLEIGNCLLADAGRGQGKLEITNPQIDFSLPPNWRIRALWAPRLWTQMRLSLEMLFHPVDVLFVPAHTVPLIHPKRTVVTIHGLEYEFCSQAYSFLERWYMRLSIRYSCLVAGTLIAVSENTRKDLISLYGVAKEKIQVISEGYEQNFQFPLAASRVREQAISNFQSNSNEQISQLSNGEKYILFIGRLEERKNVVRIIEAFELLKEKYQVPHQLVLAGKPGYGYERIKSKFQISNFKKDIIELGFVSEEEKWELLKNAEVFVFPSLYEGFGIPVLEAQSVGTPVVTANASSLPEVGGNGAVYVDPLSVESIALGIQKVLSEQHFQDGIIEKGNRNVLRFGWSRCTEEIGSLLIE